MDTNCAKSQAERVSFLLGCCGDVPVSDYPGPPFPDSMSDLVRATRALHEIEEAKTLRCYDPKSDRAKTLMLNSIGARIMRAEFYLRSPSDGNLNSGLVDVDDAARDLKHFAESERTAATQIWGWIASAFRRCGRLWDSLTFVSQLPNGCCEPGSVQATEADLLFELGAYEAASRQYSLWLTHFRPPSFCGYSSSVANTAELRKRGFKIPESSEDGLSACSIVGEWEPYMAFPAR